MGGEARKRGDTAPRPKLVRLRREKRHGPYYGPVARRLREIRESIEPELTGAELGKRIGAPNQAWISRHENGNVRIPVDELERWAAGLDHEVAVLFTPKGLPGAALLAAGEEAGPAAIADAVAFLKAWGAMSPKKRSAIRDLIEDTRKD